jgi:ATP-dependent helicase/nuclease subunit B
VKRASLFSAGRPRIFSIDAGRPFARDLAAALRTETGGDPLALSEVMIFVPTRRAARALAAAFVAQSEGRASFLPDIRPLGDVEEDELFLELPIEVEDLPPAVSALERLLILARFVAAADRAFSGQDDWPASLAAAKELAGLLDSLYTEEIPFDALKGAAPPEHAVHWERSLKFLSIVGAEWPRYLASRGRMDPSERRVKLIGMEAERIRRAAPQTPVIVAGSTGSTPAVSRLMRAAIDLPRGAIVLPGLDRTLDKKARAAIDDPHPQSGLSALLAGLGFDADSVGVWPGSGAPSARAGLFSLALRPAEATDDWRLHVDDSAALDPGFERAAAGLSIVEARDEEAEASAIALLLREAVETPLATAILATPDRNLARRVSAKMRRWDVLIDDSAGVPFANTPCGNFLRLTADWLTAPSEPAAVLSLARSGLAGFGMDPAARASALDAFDRALRGVAPGPDVEGLKSKLAREDASGKSAPIMDSIEEAARLWPRTARAPFAALLQTHLTVAERFSAENDGASRLWRGDDGEAGALLLAQLSGVADAVGESAVCDYPSAFSQMIAGATVRRSQDAHPRIAILGPLEARMQSADHVILGGLNEGVWPSEAATDPFLSRPMRRNVGLPTPERRIGLSAHDFHQLASAPRVTLTRARMAGGAPAKPSRWIVRLKNILDGAKARDRIDATKIYAAWTRSLDAPETVERSKPPAPRPPFEVRPRTLFVTRFEDLMRDPYAVYGRHILRLRPLDPHAEPPGAAQLGSLLHKVMELFVARRIDPEAPEANSGLRQLMEDYAEEHGLFGGELALWRPRIVQGLDWLLRWERTRRRVGRPAAVEAKGSATFDASRAPFTLSARVDRIDVLNDNSAAIFDYKSGALPTLDQMKASFKPQLPLTAMIVEAGGFAEIGALRAASFHYVKALNQKDERQDMSGAEGADAATCIREAAEGFRKLVDTFDDPNTPYLSQPRPQFRNEYGKFDCLARRREWAAEEDAE